MDDPGDGANVNQAVQHLPAPAAQPPDPAGRGGDRQRNQQHKSGKPSIDERTLGDILNHPAKIKLLVEPDVSGEVKTNVEERKQSQHAAEAYELGLL